MTTAIYCLLIFLIMAGLMFGRRISALLALPIMAILIAFVGKIAPEDILNLVIAKGALQLHAAYTTTMFGAMLAELMNRQGIAKAFVRYVAEFAGDNQFLLAILLTAVTALLFSTLGGLGAVIMVGTIILPVMLSIGVSNVTAGGLFLMGISIGGMFNLATWQVYSDILSVNHEQIAHFVIPFAGILSALVLVFLGFELKKSSNIIYVFTGILVITGAFFIFGSRQINISNLIAFDLTNRITMIACAIFCITLFIYAFFRHVSNKKNLPNMAMLTPFIPLVLVLVFKWEIIPAFIAGIVYGTLITWQRNSIDVLTRSMIEGVANVVPAVILMIGIGMLYKAVTDDHLKSAMAPLLIHIIPTHALAYIVIFTLVAPLSLYRGPLNIFGMGSGLAALMQKATMLAPQAIFSMMMSVGQIQGVCDPTNTQNVWTATYLSTDTKTLLARTIPYIWFAVVAGLSLSAALGYVPW